MKRRGPSPARRPAGPADQRWSRADLALLDEAESLIAGVRHTYGHIVVDEAQDLSAMELRMIARRSMQGSMTILGDLAQATAPAAQTDWSQASRLSAGPGGPAGGTDRGLSGARADHDLRQPPAPLRGAGPAST